VPKAGFWGKKDDTSMARSLRLAMIQNQYDVGNLTEEQALDLLNAPLTPGDEATWFDDSDCLETQDG